MEEALNILFAGAGSLLGINDIRNKLYQYSVDFIENKFMISKLSDDEKTNVMIADTYNFDKYNLVLPVNEYWLTECIKNNVLNISSKAKKASRDKVFFNQCLNQNHIKCCKLYNYQEISHLNGTHIVKPRYAYSGKGVSVFSREKDWTLVDCINFAEQGIHNTESITNVSENEVTFWDFIVGIEYSTDIFYYRGEIYYIRLCEKATKIINHRPCTLGYRLIDFDMKIHTAIKSWCNSIFTSEDISFAQFDFIKRDTDGCFIPIDFACRIAGGVHTLLKQLSFNPYLNALQKRKYKIDRNYTQINLISKKAGKIVSDDYIFSKCFCHKNKKTGDFVSDDITSATNRLAEFICDTTTRDEFVELVDSCLGGEFYVS